MPGSLPASASQVVIASPSVVLGRDDVSDFPFILTVLTMRGELRSHFAGCTSPGICLTFSHGRKTPTVKYLSPPAPLRACSAYVIRSPSPPGLSSFYSEVILSSSLLLPMFS